MFLCVLCVGIREHSEIKQSVSKLTEEVSVDMTVMPVYTFTTGLDLIWTVAWTKDAI